MTINAEHEQIPDYVQRAYEAVVAINQMRKDKVLGATEATLKTAISNLVVQFRRWINDHANSFLVRGSEFDTVWDRYIQYSVWQRMTDYHATLENLIRQVFAQYDELVAEIKLLESFSIPVPEAKDQTLFEYLTKLRKYFAEYWHIFHPIPEWSESDMRSMLETGILVEKDIDDGRETSDRSDTPAAG